MEKYKNQEEEKVGILYYIYIDYSENLVGYAIIKKDSIDKLLPIFKCKIKSVKDSLIIFVDVVDFVKKFDYCKIFVSVDNNQFNAFTKLLSIIPHKQHITVVGE